jgi:formylmethanofuran dehydrogenase subunit A
MSDELLLISGGRIHDPANGVDGVVGDLWIQAGRIVPPPQSPDVRPTRRIDATGMVVMPGGVDMHCHIAGPKVNAARRMSPESNRNAEPVYRTDRTRSGTMGSVPSTFATGYKYAGMGYTTAFDAAVPPLVARHVHEELHDTPCIDKGFFTLLGNNHYALQLIRDGESEQLRDFIAWTLNAVRAYSVKIVNAGGVEMWKLGQGDAHGLDDPVTSFGVTPRSIISRIATASNELGLPHPVHIHCNHLGMPGNDATTLATMQALDGRRGHLTHIQFHSYSGDPNDQSTFGSAVPKLVEYFNSHPNLTIDVGQVMFGETASMTGDGPLGYFLSRVYGRKWFSGDTELEAGCGIVPITYREKSRVHALQWAIGLEWYLLAADPWRIAMSTDHPNGGSFLAYPQIIALLMDRTRRTEMLQRVHPAVRQTTALGDLTREYSLNEIAIITRAAPARILGLPNKGRLNPGADADVTIYAPQADIERMFELPRYVIHAGRVVIDDGELRTPNEGKLLHVSPAFDPGAVGPIREWINEHSSLQFANYPVDDSYLRLHESIPTWRNT